MHSAARRFGFALISITLAFGLAACGGDSPDSGQPQASTISKADCGQVDADGVVTITSANDDFDIPCIVAPAGQAFVIRLVNTDGLPHDMQIFTDSQEELAAAREAAERLLQEEQEHKRGGH